jgi:hypothetical protein
MMKNRLGEKLMNQLVSVLVILSMASISFGFDNPFSKVANAVKEKAGELTTSDLRHPYERDRDEESVVLMVIPPNRPEATQSISDIESNIEFAEDVVAAEKGRIPHMEKGVKGDDYYTTHTITGAGLNSTIDCLSRVRSNEVEIESSSQLASHPKKSELMKKTSNARAKCLATYRKIKPLYLTALEKYFANRKATDAGSFQGYVQSFFSSQTMSYLDYRADTKVAGIFKKLGCNVPTSNEEVVTCN